MSHALNCTFSDPGRGDKIFIDRRGWYIGSAECWWSRHVFAMKNLHIYLPANIHPVMLRYFFSSDKTTFYAFCMRFVIIWTATLDVINFYCRCVLRKNLCCYDRSCSEWKFSLIIVQFSQMSYTMKSHIQAETFVAQ